jgi:NAD(P)H-flavin reductase
MLRYKITMVKKVSDGVKMFRMDPLDEKLSFKSGQFVMMSLLDKEGRVIEKRPYSIACATNSPYLEFCIKIVGGKFTSMLDNVLKGEIVGIDGPFGVMTYEGEKCAFACGGTGIAPVISMVRDVASKKLKGEYFVFYSAQYEKLLVHREELEKIAAANPNIKVVFTITREEPKGWKGKCGHLDEKIFREFIDKPKDFNWYLCGPLAMTSALKECILKMGTDPKKVHVEGWG